MDKPLLSIVIANYNYGRFLEEAIKSVLAQDMGDKIELIICDAASTDNSVEIIKKYEKHIAWWCSEPDGGQSEAFNKGFTHAKGDWFTWLNADEFYLPNTLKKFVALVTRKPQARWVTGNMLSFDSETRKILRVNWGPHKQPPFIAPRHTFDAVFGTTTFWHRSLRDEFGPIDEKLVWGMDIEYWRRFTLGGVKQTRLNHICWAFRCHGESKTTGCDHSEEVIRKKKAEAEYIASKIGGPFKASFGNIWYDLWVLWRIIDGSWLVRAWKKKTMEGMSVDVPMYSMRIKDKMKKVLLITVARIAYWLGIDNLFYCINRKAKRILTFHNVLPDDIFDHRGNGVSNKESDFAK